MNHSYGSGLRDRPKPDPYHLAVWRGRDEGIGVLLCTYGVSFYQSYGSGLRVRSKPNPYQLAVGRGRHEGKEVSLCPSQIFSTRVTDTD